MIVTTAELAALLGLSKRRISQLVTEGIAVRVSPGKFDGPASIKSYISSVSVRSDSKEADLDLNRERARLAKEQADGHEMKNAIARGELLQADAVVREWSDVLRSVRSQVMTVPSRCRALLPHLTAHDAEVLDREIRRTLTSIAADDGNANDV